LQIKQPKFPSNSNKNKSYNPDDSSEMNAEEAYKSSPMRVKNRVNPNYESRETPNNTHNKYIKPESPQNYNRQIPNQYSNEDWRSENTNSQAADYYAKNMHQNYIRKKNQESIEPNKNKFLNLNIFRDNNVLNLSFKNVMSYSVFNCLFILLF